VAVDDNSSLQSRIKQVADLANDIVVLPAPPAAPGGHGGLWVKLTTGYRWILERYVPNIILRMDSDALLIGRGLEARAMQMFDDNAKVGLLGAYRIGPDGGLRDPSWAARQLRAEIGLRGLLHAGRRSLLRRWAHQAHTHGYVDGESVLGGAYIHCYQAANRIYEQGWFNQPLMASSKLGEDHIMSLLTIAAGFRISDFGGPTDPMALKWRGLPAHPTELLATEKLITHSVRSWQNLSEQEIREIFAKARSRN
jgi:hypothetical protein